MNTPTDTAPKANAGSDEGALLPCPFCGGEALEYRVQGRGQRWAIVCERCGAGPSSGLIKPEARARWNRRAILTSTADEGAREATTADEVLSRIQDKVCECVMGDLSQEEATEEIGRLMNDHVASVLARLALAHEQAPSTARGEG